MALNSCIHPSPYTQQFFSHVFSQLDDSFWEFFKSEKSRENTNNNHKFEREKKFTPNEQKHFNNFNNSNFKPTNISISIIKLILKLLNNL